VRRELAMVPVQHVDEVMNVALHPEVVEEEPKLEPAAAS
jgi:hypothetical protein